MYPKCNVICEVTMEKDFLGQLNDVFMLMSNNKLKKDIDDTLLEKLLTFIKKCKLKSVEKNFNSIVVGDEDPSSSWLDFMKEVVQRTEVLYFIEKVIFSIVGRTDDYSVPIRCFAIRFLGFIFESCEWTFPYSKFLPLLKDSKENKVITNHIPSIQDAILSCLTHAMHKKTGAMWFCDQNLKNFVFSCFESSSYYVRKSAVNFFVDFISEWLPSNDYSQDTQLVETEFVNFIIDLVHFIIKKIHFHADSGEIMIAECCISILTELIEKKGEDLVGKFPNLVKDASKYFMDLPEEKEFKDKLIILLLRICDMYDTTGVDISEDLQNIIKCLIIQEDIKLAIDLISFLKDRQNKYCPIELKFLLLPINILMNTPLPFCEKFFEVKSDVVYSIMLKKMDNKSHCKTLFCSSLSGLQRILPIFVELRGSIGKEILKVFKCSDFSHHKWLYSVLEDRSVHYAIINFFSYCLSSDEVYNAVNEEGDLVFASLLELLKKPTSDCYFLAQLLLKMKDLLIMGELLQLDIRETEIGVLIQIVSRMLQKNRESIIDSALHLAGQVIFYSECEKNCPVKDLQDRLLKGDIPLIIWDIAIQGNCDGAIRSTALKVLINSCCDVPWYLNEVKSTKDITETDIAKILCNLTYDPDFFLQREALSSLLKWMKAKWNELQPCKNYIYTALVYAAKSLDLELKLISLDVWCWLMKKEFAYSTISPSLDIKEYIEFLVSSGFGLSMVLAYEDYDPAVQYEAASILSKLKQILIQNNNSFESLELDSHMEIETTNCIIPQNTVELISKNQKDNGINTVMELSTTEQITNICRPFHSSELYDFKQERFSNDNTERTCSVSLFWTCLWSENIDSILQPQNNESDLTEGKSLLNDIISAKVVEYDMTDETHDCY